MPTYEVPWSAERFASLARAASEAERFAHGEADGELARVVSGAHAAVGDDLPDELLRQIEAGFAKAAPKAADTAPKLGGEGGSMQELLKQRATLELKLQHELESRKDLEKKVAVERTEYQQAIESLNLQRAKIKELEGGRAQLLAEIRGLEDKLRMQINETEQASLKYQKLQESRKTLGDQATGQTERINELEAEIKRLKEQAEAALKERDTARESARQDVDAAESKTEKAAFAELWARMQKEFPELFLDTHVPNRKTFENICDGFVEMTRTMMVLEAHIHHMLRELRNVGDPNDKLSQFYTMFSKNPSLLLTMRDYLATRKRSSNVENIMRAIQAWTRAFGSGLHKAILQSDRMLAEELNWKKWPINKGWGKEEAAIGKHFLEVVHKGAPDKLGTEMKREAAEYAHQDYMSYFRRGK